MVVVSDRKVYDGTVFKADLVSTTDYYAFGMVMSDRSYNTEGYRFGFNGKENDNEVKGTGNSLDFGDRIYDPRLGRWLAVDMQAKNSPDLTPFRFGFNNPIVYKDPNGQWEEDGHYWTIYAMGIAMGLSKPVAEYIAWKAEYPDHFVHQNSNMSIHPHKSGIAWGKDGGLGTWADPELQMDWHGLTGGLQKHVNDRAKSLVLSGNLIYLHLLGDSWAHSYINEKGNRVMYGKMDRNNPMYAWVARMFLGDITFEHAEGGPEHGKHADDIAQKAYEYSMYVRDLKNIFNSDKFRFSYQITNSDPSLAIFEYVQKNGGNKENNIFLLKSYIDIKSGVTEFNNLTDNQTKLLQGFLKETGVKFTASAPKFGGIDSRGNSVQYEKNSIKINKKSVAVSPRHF